MIKTAIKGENTMFDVRILPGGQILSAPEGKNLMELLRENGLLPDAPCGGRGTCGKCRALADGEPVLTCQTHVHGNMTVELEQKRQAEILTGGQNVEIRPDGCSRYVLAIDIGTTTVVAYLLDGNTGNTLSRASCINPQNRYGADVISRIQYAMDGEGEQLKTVIRQALDSLTRSAAQQAGIRPEQIGVAAIVGNTAMHHLLLGIDSRPLTVPPYMPNVYEALEEKPEGLLPISPEGTVRILPNIAGFVGADTVGCMVSTRFDRQETLTLMIDIGTNGEMVLGDRNRRITCSTAAGPAFEGAKIQCGMRGETGAVDHVWLENGQVRYSVIGGGEAAGLCGSGLLDLVAVLLETGVIDESGRMEEKTYHLGGSVVLTQKDVREVQLAKSAIRTGVELMADRLGAAVEDIRQVYLAGAFGNYMNPESACAIGMIPPVLLEKIRPIGNAAGEGARLCALSAGEYDYSKALAAGTEFLELASLPEFNDSYVDYLSFEEEE